MIKKAFGGILLVDEAYYLYNAANDKDYGQESIEILLNVMEEQKDDLIVTLAGCVPRTSLLPEVRVVIIYEVLEGHAPYFFLNTPSQHTANLYRMRLDFLRRQ